MLTSLMSESDREYNIMAVKINNHSELVFPEMFVVVYLRFSINAPFSISFSDSKLLSVLF